MIRYSIQDNATPALWRKARALGARGTKVMGAAQARIVKGHLSNRNQQPNKHGWKKTNYYGDAAKSVNWKSDPTSCDVHVSKEGFRVRVEGTGHLPGGVIRPINFKYLAIPIAEEAYGQRAREVPGLRLGIVHWDGRTTKGLVDALGNGMFALIRSARQSGDRTVMPSDDELIGASLGAIDKLAHKTS